MAMTLQEAIDFASVHADTDEYGIEVSVGISMHDDQGSVRVKDSSRCWVGRGSPRRSLPVPRRGSRPWLTGDRVTDSLDCASS
jgi:hypothetical protein